jgi:hypothetical protein
MSYIFISVNSFKHPMWFCSCFPEYGKKIDVRSMLRDNKETKLCAAATDEMIDLERPFN